MHSEADPVRASDGGQRAARVRSQLARILASAGFVKSPRMQQFLEFVVERTLAGQIDRLKESIIGVEVFGCAPGYDPKAKPIVRTEAHRLREKIREYFEAEGMHDRVVITLPKGGYIAGFEIKPEPLPRCPEVVSFPVREQIARPLKPAASLRFLGWALALVACGAAVPLASRLSRKTVPIPTLTPLTTSRGIAIRPRFSPDGHRVAYAWDGGGGGGSGKFSIYVKVVNMGDPLRLTTNDAQDLDPAWSPDGRQIAFVRLTPGKQELYVIPSLGGAERKLTEIFAAAYHWSADGAHYMRSFGPAWSPDGQQIAITNAASGEPDSIYLFNVETGQNRRLTVPESPGEADSEPVFSPRGDQIAFIRSKAGAGGSPEIYLQPVAGSRARQLTFDHSQLMGLAWTSDGGQIVFSSQRDGQDKLWQVPATGGSPLPVPGAGTRAHNPTISSDRHRLAYAEQFSSTSVWRAELGPHSSVPVPFLYSIRTDTSPQYSPDGRRVVFISNRSGPARIWTCDPDGRNARLIETSPGIQPGTPRWSPDGKQIVFDSRHEGFSGIYVVAANGGQVRRVSPDKMTSMIPCWSNDGKSVFYSSNRSGSWQIWKQGLDGGVPTMLTRLGGLEAKESPDGKTLYYVTKNAVNPGLLWQVPVDGGEETAVRGLETVSVGRQWALAGSGIYYISKSGNPPSLIYFDFASQTSTRVLTLAHAPIIGSPGPVLSPDGRWILYSQVEQEASNIMLLENFQ